MVTFPRDRLRGWVLLLVLLREREPDEPLRERVVELRERAEAPVERFLAVPPRWLLPPRALVLRLELLAPERDCDLLRACPLELRPEERLLEVLAADRDFILPREPVERLVDFREELRAVVERRDEFLLVEVLGIVNSSHHNNFAI